MVVVGFAGSAGFALLPKLKLGAETVAEALLFAGVDAAEDVAAGAAAVADDDELKLKPGVIDGPAGF